MEQKLYFDPFVFISEIGVNYFCTKNGSTIELNKIEAEYLCSHPSFTKKELDSSITAKTLQKLTKAGCFLPFSFDLEAEQSRTDGYFWESGNWNEYKKLKNSHVFLLGAGALGTHLGW